MEPQPCREEMEQIIAEQSTFKTEAEQRLGKTVVKQVEKRLAAYPSKKEQSRKA